MIPKPSIYQRVHGPTPVQDFQPLSLSAFMFLNHIVQRLFLCYDLKKQERARL